MHPFIVTYRLEDGTTNFERVRANDVDGAQEAYVARCEEECVPVRDIVSIRRG